MIQEGRKRDIAANALLGFAFAANAAQSPIDFVRTGSVEAPGVQLMSRMMKKRGEAERNLDSGRVSHPARNRKMKTFKEFVEEAYLVEMRKEDKVAGKKKTPLTIPVTSKHVRKDDGSWKVTKVVTQKPNPTVQFGRYKQGRGMPGDLGHHHYSTEGGTGGGPGFGYKPQPHGEGGALRGVKKSPARSGDTPGPSRTPAQKVADKRAKKAYKGYDYKNRW
jgi:hypothetical protein